MQTPPTLPFDRDALPDLSGAETLATVPDAFRDLIVSVRRHLHQHPELGLLEEQTARFLQDLFLSFGLEVHRVAGTGLFVDIEGALPGPHVGYRADIDALPIQDAKRVPYASQCPGVAHLCGHDAHTSVGVGVALLLYAQRDRMRGTVRVFFQPNEEGTPGGSLKMIEAGVLEGLEAAYAVHVDPALPVGRYGLITGAATAAADRFDVTVHAGKTGHSARPHATVDTVWVATQAASTLYQLVGRISDARNAAVLTICRFRGGEAYNVIPADVSFGGTFRCTDPDDRLLIKEQIHRTAAHYAHLYGVHVDVAYEDGAPPVMNDTRLVANLSRTVQELYGEEAIYHIPRPSMGAEDFANYLEHVPGALLRVGTSSSPATSFPLHDAQFDLDESALMPTALLMSRVLLNHLAHGVL